MKVNHRTSLEPKEIKNPDNSILWNILKDHLKLNERAISIIFIFCFFFTTWIYPFYGALPYCGSYLLVQQQFQKFSLLFTDVQKFIKEPNLFYCYLCKFLCHLQKFVWRNNLNWKGVWWFQTYFLPRGAFR